MKATRIRKFQIWNQGDINEISFGADKMRTVIAIALALFIKWLLRTDFDHTAAFFFAIGFALCLAADIYEIAIMRKRLK